MNNELIAKIEALPDRDQLIWADPFIKIADLKSLAAELTLANKKIELLQASNDHYARTSNWRRGLSCERADKWWRSDVNGYDFARKTQEEIARLEGENGRQM